MRLYSTWPFIRALITANIFGEMYPTMTPKLLLEETGFFLENWLLDPVEMFKH